MAKRSRRARFAVVMSSEVEISLTVSLRSERQLEIPRLRSERHPFDRDTVSSWCGPILRLKITLNEIEYESLVWGKAVLCAQPGKRPQTLLFSLPKAESNVLSEIAGTKSSVDPLSSIGITSPGHN